MDGQLGFWPDEDRKVVEPWKTRPQTGPPYISRLIDLWPPLTDPVLSFAISPPSPKLETRLTRLSRPSRLHSAALCLSTRHGRGPGGVRCAEATKPRCLHRHGGQRRNRLAGDSRSQAAGTSNPAVGVATALHLHGYMLRRRVVAESPWPGLVGSGAERALPTGSRRPQLVASLVRTLSSIACGGEKGPHRCIVPSAARVYCPATSSDQWRDVPAIGPGGVEDGGVEVLWLA